MSQLRCNGILRWDNFRADPVDSATQPSFIGTVSDGDTDFPKYSQLRSMCFSFRFAFLIVLTLAVLIPVRGTGNPNVIFFMADDMGMGDTSAYQDFTGNADDVQMDTPNMERLARMGIRFTDAHAPASRCTMSRYGLLTGRYPWRSRLKYWVLFGAQGDPLIEKDRPTLATLFRDKGYGTAMVGKWHLGLRYRNSIQLPAAGWDDADLTQALFNTPLDHGFDYARFTSRSHGTSGPDVGRADGRKKNGVNQRIGPGHIRGRVVIGATGDGKRLISSGPNAYVLTELGSRHSDDAISYLDTHLAGGEHARKPFFLYYPSNSNHSPYTPDDQVGGKAVAGAARTKSGNTMDARHNFIYENDVALGRLLDYLENHDDPRNPGRKLIETTLIVFTSDNGAEKDSNTATGPFRSNKGSCYEGGHRIPFIVAWAAGGIGNGDSKTPGKSSDALIGLTDMFATFAELIGSKMADLFQGGKGGEDSISVLSAWRGDKFERPVPLFFCDHKQSRADPAVLAMRSDTQETDPKGKWKIFFDANLARSGEAKPIELYNLASDSEEENNLIAQTDLQTLVKRMTALALLHRNTGGHRFAEHFTIPLSERPTGQQSKAREKLPQSSPLVFDWRRSRSLAGKFRGKSCEKVEVDSGDGNVTMTVSAVRNGSVLGDRVFQVNQRGLGISGGKFDQVDDGEELEIGFDRDVIIESATVVAGNGICGGSYWKAQEAPLEIYCIDADNDSRDQRGVISDIGLLTAGQILHLSSAPQYQSEPVGRWRLGAIKVRSLPKH